MTSICGISKTGSPLTVNHHDSLNYIIPGTV